jgi:hypothetical protein
VTEIDRETLISLGKKYLWWRSAEQALTMPRRVIAQVMNIGDYGDVQLVANIVGDETLRDILLHAEIGQFNPRSWAYWHYRLGLAEEGKVPPLPLRKLSA